MSWIIRLLADLFIDRLFSGLIIPYFKKFLKSIERKKVEDDANKKAQEEIKNVKDADTIDKARDAISDLD